MRIFLWMDDDDTFEAAEELVNKLEAENPDYPVEVRVRYEG